MWVNSVADWWAGSPCDEGRVPRVKPHPFVRVYLHIYVLVCTWRTFVCTCVGVGAHSDVPDGDYEDLDGQSFERVEPVVLGQLVRPQSSGARLSSPEMLPLSWGMRRASGGRIFYEDHVNKVRVHALSNPISGAAPALRMRLKHWSS
jgi:hypothetical protein